jgi:hypothetical protein
MSFDLHSTIAGFTEHVQLVSSLYFHQLSVGSGPLKTSTLQFQKCSARQPPTVCRYCHDIDRTKCLGRVCYFSYLCGYQSTSKNRRCHIEILKVRDEGVIGSFFLALRGKSDAHFIGFLEILGKHFLTPFLFHVTVKKVRDNLGIIFELIRVIAHDRFCMAENLLHVTFVVSEYPFIANGLCPFFGGIHRVD